MALAKLRKEAVLMDVEFPLPAPEPKVYKPRAPKGHAFERAKIERYVHELIVDLAIQAFRPGGANSGTWRKVGCKSCHDSHAG